MLALLVLYIELNQLSCENMNLQQEHEFKEICHMLKMNPQQQQDVKNYCDQTMEYIQRDKSIENGRQLGINLGIEIASQLRQKITQQKLKKECVQGFVDGVLRGFEEELRQSQTTIWCQIQQVELQRQNDAVFEQEYREGMLLGITEGNCVVSKLQQGPEEEPLANLKLQKLKELSDTAFEQGLQLGFIHEMRKSHTK